MFLNVSAFMEKNLIAFFSIQITTFAIRKKITNTIILRAKLLRTYLGISLRIGDWLDPRALITMLSNLSISLLPAHSTL